MNGIPRKQRLCPTQKCAKMAEKRIVIVTKQLFSSEKVNCFGKMMPIYASLHHCISTLIR